MCCCNTRIVQLGTINNPPFTFQITAGDYKWVKLHGIWGTGVSSTGFGLCVRWGFPALKLNSSTNFNLSTND